MSDGDWDWYNYSRVVLETSQRRDFKCTCLAAVHFNVWCAIGNMVHVVHSHLLKKEVCALSLSLSLSLSFLTMIFFLLLQSTFSVHTSKKAEVSHMVPVGDGVWISFKFDSTLRLFHGTTLTCMQDLDIGPSVQRILGEIQCTIISLTHIHVGLCLSVHIVSWQFVLVLVLVLL